MELWGFDNQESYQSRQGLFQYVKPTLPTGIPSTTKPDPVSQIPEIAITVTVTPGGGIEVTIPSDVAALIQQSQAQAAPLTTGAGGLFSPHHSATLMGAGAAQHSPLPTAALAAAWVALPRSHPIPDVMVKTPTAFMSATSVLGGMTQSGTTPNTTGRNNTPTVHLSHVMGTPHTSSQSGPVFTGGNAVVATISLTVLQQIIDRVVPLLQSRFPEMSFNEVQTVIQETLNSFSTSLTSTQNPSLPSIVTQTPTTIREVARQLLSSTLLETTFSKNSPQTLNPQPSMGQVPRSPTGLTGGSSTQEPRRTTSSPENPLPSNSTGQLPREQTPAGRLPLGAQRFASQPPPLKVPSGAVQGGAQPSRLTPHPSPSSSVTTRHGAGSNIPSTGTKNSRGDPVVFADVETVRGLPHDSLRPSGAPETREQQRTFNGSSNQEQENQKELWQTVREELAGRFSEAVIDQVLARLASYSKMIEALSEPLRDVWTELKLIPKNGMTSFTPEDLECFQCHMRVVELFLNRPDWISKFLPEERTELEDLKPYVSETRELLNQLKPKLTHREGEKSYWS